MPLFKPPAPTSELLEAVQSKDSNRVAELLCGGHDPRGSPEKESGWTPLTCAAFSADAECVALVAAASLLLRWSRGASPPNVGADQHSSSELFSRRPLADAALGRTALHWAAHAGDMVGPALVHALAMAHHLSTPQGISAVRDAAGPSWHGCGFDASLMDTAANELSRCVARGPAAGHGTSAVGAAGVAEEPPSVLPGFLRALAGALQRLPVPATGHPPPRTLREWSGARDHQGRTALHLAAEIGSLWICVALVGAAGADVRAGCALDPTTAATAPSQSLSEAQSQAQSPAQSQEQSPAQSLSPPPPESQKGAPAGSEGGTHSGPADRRAARPAPSAALFGAGSTPLHDAARNGHWEVVEYLVAADRAAEALPLPRDEKQRTPLHLAFSSSARRLKACARIAEALLSPMRERDRRSEWHAKSAFGATPIELWGGGRGKGARFAVTADMLPDSSDGPGWYAVPFVFCLVLFALADAASVPWYAAGALLAASGAVVSRVSRAPSVRALFRGGGTDAMSLSLFVSTMFHLGLYVLVLCPYHGVPLMPVIVALWAGSLAAHAVCARHAWAIRGTRRAAHSPPRGLAGARGDGGSSPWAVAVDRVARYGETPPEELCRACRAIRDVRGKHCRSCGTCAAGVFDHHCPFGGGCIASGNHLAFIVFVGLLGAAGIAFAYAMFPYGVNGGDRGALVRAVYVIPFTLLALGLFVSHSVMVARNVSTRETVKWRDMRHMRNNCTNTRDDRGPVANCTERLCTAAHMAIDRPEDSTGVPRAPGHVV